MNFSYIAYNRLIYFQTAFFIFYSNPFYLASF